MESQENILNSVLATKPLVILGEMHGAAVNVDIIKSLVSKLDINCLMLELPARHGLLDFNELLKTHQWIKESGLISKKHIEMFDQFKKEGKKIIPIKIEDKDWNIAEKKTAEYIRETISGGERTLLIVGNLHARKTLFKIGSYNYVPLGFLLKDLATSIHIRYGSGEIRNFGIVPVRDETAYSYTGNEALVKSKGKFFDFDFFVKKTVPTEILE